MMATASWMESLAKTSPTPPARRSAASGWSSNAARLCASQILPPQQNRPMKLRLFASAKPIIGMIHVGALPGTPANQLPLNKIVAAAVREAKIYREAGVDG